MTIIKSASYDEIISRLVGASIDVKHFILIADERTLLNRLMGRGEEPGSWCEQQISNCLNSFQDSITGIKINTEACAASRIALEILKHLSK